MPAPDFGPSLVHMFRASARLGGAQPFLWAKRDGAFLPWSWTRVRDEVDAFARALVGLGVEPGDRVLLVSENRPEWAIADLAIMSAGAISVPAYTTNTVNDHAYLLSHAEPKAVVSSSGACLDRLLPALREAESTRMLLLMDETAEVDTSDVTVHTWRELLSRGESGTDRGDAVAGDDTA